MENRLTFTFSPKESMDVVIIQNIEEERLGSLEKVRVGKWMTWCLFLREGCYLSASCQDEVKEKTRNLNAKITQKQEDKTESEINFLERLREDYLASHNHDDTTCMIDERIDKLKKETVKVSEK